MRYALVVLLSAVVFCCSCSNTPYDDPAHIIFSDISGVYGADVEQHGLGRLAMTIELLENARTVYKAEITNLVGDTQTKLEGIGTLADDHLILNFDRGKTTDFYYESKVTSVGEGSYELNGQFIYPDSKGGVAAVFTQSLPGN